MRKFTDEQIEKEIIQQAEKIAAVDPSLGFEGTMLPTADMSAIVLPVLRKHIGFTRLTKTRAFGNGYVVWDSDTEQWIRNEGLAEKWVEVTDDIRLTLSKLVTKYQSQNLNDSNAKKVRQIIHGALTSAKQMRKSNGGYTQVVLAAKPGLKLSEEFLLAQNFKWLLSLCDSSGEIQAMRLSALNEMNTKAGYIGALDWSKHIVPQLKEMGLVKTTDNRPLIRLDQDKVRDTLEAFIQQHDL